MTLRDLKLQWMYASPENVYKEFFNKVLKESDECMRFGGVFSSRTFADCASGMQEFVQNNGKMKLILVSEFSDDDVNAIQKGTKNEEDLIIKNWITEISEIKDKFEEDHVKALLKVLTVGKIFETYNIGGQKEISNLELVYLIFNQSFTV